MKKENLPFLVIMASLTLIILNFITSGDFSDLGFWMRILASVFLIFAMITIISKRKKQS